MRSKVMLGNAELVVVAAEAKMYLTTIGCD